MFDAPAGLALAAGMLAAVNPCGFAMLPAYLSFLVIGPTSGEPAPGRAAVTSALSRALLATAAMTVGFIAVFGVFGLLASSAADVLARNLPWATIVIGISLVALGIWLLAGRELPTFVPKLTRAPNVTRAFGSMVVFGAAFAIASLGCTIGPFLAIVFLATESFATGVTLFSAYALGMGLVVGTIAVAAALAQDGIIRLMRRALPLVNRAAGVLLVLAGAYVAWYGWFEIRVFRGGGTGDPIITGAANIQRALSRTVSGLGPGGIAIVGGALVLLLALVVTLTRHRRRAPDQPRVRR